MCFFFFFSSRRRHTRCLSDWSSDVCSSDLYVNECLAGKSGPRARDFNMRWIASLVAETHRILMRGGVFMRSEERRVGKECRCRWGTGHERKKIEQNVSVGEVVRR